MSDHRESLILMPSPSSKTVVTETIPVQETSLQRIYRENEVTQQLIQQQQRVTPNLEVIGGLDIAAEYLRGSEDPDAAKFMEVYDRVYEDRDFLEFEGICVVAKVSGKKLWGIILSETIIDKQQSVALITAMKMPAVVAKTAELALEPFGHRERALMAKGSGWISSGKGSQTNVQVNVANMAGRQGVQANMQLPPFDQDIRELGEKFQSMGSDPKILEGKV